MARSDTLLFFIIWASVSCLVTTKAAQNAAQNSNKTSYEGYQVLRCYVETTKQVEGLRKLMREERADLDFWTEPNMVRQKVDIMTTDPMDKHLETLILSTGMSCEVTITDVSQIIKSERRSGSNLRYHMSPEAMLEARNYYKDFQRYGVIEEKLKSLANDSRVDLTIASRSHEGRPIYLVKISDGEGENKKKIFIDGGHHAREWISTTTAMYILESLLSDSMPPAQQNWGFSRVGLNSSDLLKDVLKSYDILMVPVVNPDGYEYTHTSDRLWRKNRAPEYCSGVDVNRNYDIHWMETGASRNQCSEIYAGSKPLSEPESQAIASIINAYSSDLVAYMSLHCYGGYILTPYGHERSYPPNYREMMRVARIGARAIRNVRGTRYTVGTSSIVLYPASGGSDDYAYDKGVRYSYTFELPSVNGFITPASEIIPVGMETVAGLSAMIKSLQ